MARTKAKRARLNMRVPEDLLKWVKEFAAEKNTTVTQIVIDHMTFLRLHGVRKDTSRG